MARALLTALAAALLLTALPAQAAPGDNVEAVAGDLRIVHLWTRDPDAFMEAWNGPTPPNLPTTSSALSNQRLTQIILYGNCTPDAAGNCTLEARVEITAPDGTPYGEPMLFTALPTSPAGPRNTFLMSAASIGLVVEDGEQLGTYRVRLLVTDPVAGQTAESVVSLTIGADNDEHD